jgi:DNA-binding response OmpR family regulator
MPQRILLIEDDHSILKGLQMNLSLEGFDVVAARDGEEGLKLHRSHRPDLIVLDMMLPKQSGLDVIRAVRSDDPDTSIVVLSAKDQEADKVLALSLGADDYVSKPFGLAELVARIRAALRRRRKAPAPTTGNVVLDVDTRLITVGGRRIDATAREFDLLRYLVEHPGVVHSRERLMQRVWGPDHFGTLRTVDNFIARLRGKIERDPDNPEHLETVRGVGYRYNP